MLSSYNILYREALTCRYVVLRYLSIYALRAIVLILINIIGRMMNVHTSTLMLRRLSPTGSQGSNVTIPVLFSAVSLMKPPCVPLVHCIGDLYGSRE